eukprot:3029035-Rhodomonas_salina.2
MRSVTPAFPKSSQSPVPAIARSTAFRGWRVLGHGCIMIAAGCQRCCVLSGTDVGHGWGPGRSDSSLAARRFLCRY